MSRKGFLAGKSRMRPGATLVLCALLILAVWVLGIGKAPIVLDEMNKPGLKPGLEFRDSKKSFSTEQGDEYGEVSRGPGLLLTKGRYRLSWIIETDAENVIRITSQNGARIEPSQIVIPADTWSISEDFEILDSAEGVEFRIDFQAGSTLRVQSIDLVTPENTDNTWSLTFLILFAGLAAYCAQTKKVSAQGWEALMMMGMAVVIASMPSLKMTVYTGHDYSFHALRIHDLADGLQSGQFPVRAGGYSYMGYGAVTSAFYPEMFCYFPAVLMLTGATEAYAMNAFQIGMNALAALTMFLCARRLLGGLWQGTCASVLYTLASYRLTDVYTRFAVGEALAMAVLPLFIWGMYEVFFGDKARWRMLVLGATCVFQSHMLSTMICAVSAVLMTALFLPRLISRRRLGALLKAAAAAVLVNLFFLVPFVTLSRQGIGAEGLLRWNAQRALSPSQLLLQGTQALGGTHRDWTLEYFPVELGFPLLLSGMLGLRAALLAPRGSARRRGALYLVLAGAAFAFATTTFFPWSWLTDVTNRMSDYLQFPWRLLMMAAALLALAGGIGFCVLAEGRERQMAVFVLSLAAVVQLPCLTELATSNTALLPYEVTLPELRIGDYLIPGSNLERMTEQDPVIEGDAQIAEWEKAGTKATAQVKADAEAVLTLPMFGYDGYAAEVDGERMEVGLGDNNRLTVKLPAGTCGTLRVHYAGKPYWRISDAISLAALLALLAGAAKKRRTYPAD